MKPPTSCVEKIMSKVDRIAVKQLQHIIESQGREIDCTWDGKWLRAVYVGYYGYDMKVNAPVGMIRKLGNEYVERLTDLRYTTLDAMSPHVFNTLNERNNQTLVFVANENTKKCRLMDIDSLRYIIRELSEYVIGYALRSVGDELKLKDTALKKTPRIVVPDELLRPYEGEYKFVEVPAEDQALMINTIRTCAGQLHLQTRLSQFQEQLNERLRDGIKLNTQRLFAREVGANEWDVNYLGANEWDSNYVYTEATLCGNNWD